LLLLAGKGLGLVTTVFALIWAIGQFDNRFPPADHNVARLHAARMFDKLDYLVVGPSYVYNGVDPKVFDDFHLRIYDLAIATAGPYYYELMVDDYLRNAAIPPKAIIFNISLISLCGESDNWSSYPIYRYVRPPIRNETLLRTGYISLDGYIRVMRSSFKNGAAKLVGVGGSESSKMEELERDAARLKGFQPTDDIYADAMLVKYMAIYANLWRCTYLPSKEEQLWKLIDKYRFKNIEVILNEIPTFKLATFFNQPYKERYERLKAAMADRGVRIMGTGISLDPTCFSSPDHMNSKGAKIYSEFLARELEKERAKGIKSKAVP
jgi:hypothetical protein